MSKAVLAAFAIASFGTAFAQSDSATSVTLEEITVTAQRKAESLQDAAIPVDAATQARLTQIGITDASGLTKISPALTVVSGGGSNNVFFVRGVGNFAVNAYTDAAVAFNVDGVYIGRPTATTASFLDLERVEVLKGPQGTLYGRNATAGAINVIPAKPVLGEMTGYVSAGAGDYGSLEATGAINVPLGERWAARFAVGKVENDGYNDDNTAATDDLAFRGQIFGEISDTFDARLSIDHSTTTGTGAAPTYLGNYGFPLAGPSNDPNNVTGYNFNPAPANVSTAHNGPYTPESRAYYGSLDTTPAFTSPAPQRDAFLDNRYTGITAELNFDLGFGELAVIPAYREADLDVVFVNPGFQAAFNQEQHEQFSLEARLATSTESIDWIFGAYYFDETVDALASYNQQSIQATQTINASKSDSKALFARGTFNLSDQFRFVAGIRWTDDEKRFDGVSNTFLDLCIREVEAFPGGPLIPDCAGAPVIPAGITVADTLAQIDPADLPAGPPGIGTGPVPFGQVPLFPGAPPTVTGNLLFINPAVVNQTQTEDEITYRLALEYDVSDDSLIYASYETGYRSGGFSLATGRETYAPEFLDALTIGSKNRFLDNRLQLNAELFMWKYKDQQASHFGVDGNGNNAFFTENIGKSSVNGLEVDVLFAATDSTRLRGNVQFLDNEIDRYGYLQLTPDEAVRPVSGCATTQVAIVPNGATWDVNCAGQEGRNSPNLSASLGIDQSFALGSLDAMLSIDARYRDKRWVGFDFTPPQRADSVTKIDASLQIGSAEGTWSVLAYVRNATDEEVRSIAQIFGSMSNLTSTVYEPPRTYGVRFNYEF